MRFSSIGNVSAPQTAKPYSRQTASAEALGAGVGAALQNLGIAAEQWSLFKQKRDRQNAANAAELEFSRYQGDMSRDTLDRGQAAGHGAVGFTDETEARLRAAAQERLALIQDPEVRRAYEVRYENFIQSGTTQAFEFEFSRAAQAYEEDFRSILTTAQERVYADPASYENELAALESNIRASTLTVPEQDALLHEAELALVQSAFERDAENAEYNNAPVEGFDGTGPAAPNLSGPQVGLLNAIAGPESGGNYNARYPGTTFEGYADHPRIYVDGPHGRTSAAGRYQFVASTWDDEVARMAREGIIIPDFSPVSQDRVALHYASRVYAEAARENGWQHSTLAAALESGDRGVLANVRSALAGAPGARIWAGLANVSDDSFANTILGSQGARGGGTDPTSGVPDILNDPRYGDIPFETRIQLQHSAQDRVAQARAAAAAEARQMEQQTTNAVLVMNQNGDPNTLAAAEIALSSVTDAGLRQQILDATEDARTRRDNVLAVEGAIQQGHTLGAESDAAIMDYHTERQTVAGLRAGDPAAAQQLALDSQAIGYIPQPIVAQLLSQLGSRTPGMPAYAAETLARLYAQDPAGFARNATEAQVREVTILARQMEYGGVEEALQQHTAAMDPRNAALREALSNEAEAAFRNDPPSAEYIANSVFDTFGRDNYEVPMTGPAAQQLQSDYRDLYIEGYVRFGDEDKARQYAEDMITYSWAPDPLTGAIMQYSPLGMGVNVVELDGSRDWIGPMIRETVGVDEDTAVALTATAETRAQIARGETPTYGTWITQKDALGFEFIVPGPPVTIRPTDTQRLTEDYRRDRMELEATLKRVGAEYDEDEQVLSTPSDMPEEDKQIAIRAGRRLARLDNLGLEGYIENNGLSPAAPQTEAGRFPAPLEAGWGEATLPGGDRPMLERSVAELLGPIDLTTSPEVPPTFAGPGPTPEAEVRRPQVEDTVQDVPPGGLAAPGGSEGFSAGVETLDMPRLLRSAVDDLRQVPGIDQTALAAIDASGRNSSETLRQLMSLVARLPEGEARDEQFSRLAMLLAGRSS